MGNIDNDQETFDKDQSRVHQPVWTNDIDNLYQMAPLVSSFLSVSGTNDIDQSISNFPALESR